MSVSSAFQCLLLLALLCGCRTHSKPESYNRIILDGDPNPTFRQEYSKAGEITRVGNVPRGQGRTDESTQAIQPSQQFPVQTNPQ